MAGFSLPDPPTSLCSVSAPPEAGVARSERVSLSAGDRDGCSEPRWSSPGFPCSDPLLSLTNALSSGFPAKGVAPGLCWGFSCWVPLGRRKGFRGT